MSNVIPPSNAGRTATSGRATAGDGRDGDGRSDRPALWAGLLLGLSVAAAYANSLGGPFVYDDIDAITDNPTLREWWRLGHVLAPPANATVSGRPVLNVSLAINYAISGTAVWSYHVLNVSIHLAATLALFGLVRRTLAAGPRAATSTTGSWVQRSRWSAHATAIALAVSLLWGLHPLVTEAVDYVVQRAESLMSLFLLLTLYCFARGVAAISVPPQGAGSASSRWWIASIISCTLGMATKENMAAAPILVLLYDRAFVAGSFAAAWRARRRYYLALAATWILLAYLVLSTGGDRSGTVGFGTAVSPLQYWVTQPRALLRYLALSFWPAPLIFDYGTPWAHGFGEVAWRALLVVLLVSVAARLVWRNRPAGFLAAAALAVLAPTSLMPGVAQIIVEHRMYLPLAAVLTAAVAGCWSLFGSNARSLVIGGALALLALTAARNAAYRTHLALWSDTAAKCPDNARAYFNIGYGLQAEGRPADAVRWYRQAVELYPGYLEARNNLGNTLCQLGRPGEAVPEYEAALRLAPHSAGAHNDLGNALYALGQPAAAIPHYEEALRLNPRYRDACVNLGAALVQAGRPVDALPYLQRAVEMDPRRADAEAGLANAFARAGRLDQAFSHFSAALQRDPQNAELHAMYANALADANRLDEAIAQFEAAVRLQPTLVAVQFNYGATLLAAGRTAEAVAHFEAALRLQPDFAPARNALDQIRAAQPDR